MYPTTRNVLILLLVLMAGGMAFGFSQGATPDVQALLALMYGLGAGMAVCAMLLVASSRRSNWRARPGRNSASAASTTNKRDPQDKGAAEAEMTRCGVSFVGNDSSLARLPATRGKRLQKRTVSAFLLLLPEG